MRRLSVGLAVAVVALFAAVLIRARVRRPVSDMLDWAAAWLDRAPGLAGTARYLWAPHNEHHLVWARLLAAADFGALGGRGWAFVAAATVATLMTGAILVRTGWRAVGPAGAMAALLALGAPAALDAAVPIYTVYPLAVCGAVLALFLAASGRFVAALAACAAAALANGVGLAAWPALLWCVWRGGAGRAWCATAAGAGLLFALVYRIGLPVPARPDAAAALMTGLGFLGLPLSAARAGLLPGAVLGAALLAGAGVALWRASRGSDKPEAWRLLAGSLLVFSLAAACMAALGRAGAPGAVLPLRYAVLAMPLQVALIWLALDGVPRRAGFAPALVSCPRSSPSSLAKVGDQQATETKELVSRFRPHLNATNFGIGALGAFILAAQLLLAARILPVQQRWNALADAFARGERSPEMVPLVYPDLDRAAAIAARLKARGLPGP